MGIYGTRDGIFTVKKLAIQDKIPISFNIPVTATVATGAIVGGLDVNTATTAITATTFSVQPPYPLNIGVTSNSGATRRTDRLRITGYDSLGNLRYEDVQIGSGAGSTYYTNYSYIQLSNLKPYNSSGSVATSASSDIGVGYGNKVGVPGPIATVADILLYTTGSTAATTMPTVTENYNQITVSGAATARKSVHIMYLSKLQEK